MGMHNWDDEAAFAVALRQNRPTIALTLAAVPGLFLPSFPADLKPENYVFTSQDESSPMRLIDFGCAKVAADDEVISDVAGSPYYCSPEVGSPQAGAGGGKARA